MSTTTRTPAQSSVRVVNDAIDRLCREAKALAPKVTQQALATCECAVLSSFGINQAKALRKVAVALALNTLTSEDDDVLAVSPLDRSTADALIGRWQAGQPATAEQVELFLAVVADAHDAAAAQPDLATAVSNIFARFGITDITFVDPT